MPTLEKSRSTGPATLEKIGGDGATSAGIVLPALPKRVPRFIPLSAQQKPATEELWTPWYPVVWTIFGVVAALCASVTLSIFMVVVWMSLTGAHP